MFSKSRLNDPAKTAGDTPKTEPREEAGARPRVGLNLGGGEGPAPAAPAAPKSRPAPSILSSDLHVTGNIQSTGDIQVEGQVDGDIRAHLLTVGESATVKGEVVADDVVVNGRVVGRVRGLKVRLTSTARVEGDIIHKTIAIESGAHFEGSVQRQDDPLASGGKVAAAKPATPAKPAASAAAQDAATGSK